MRPGDEPGFNPPSRASNGSEAGPGATQEAEAASGCLGNDGPAGSVPAALLLPRNTENELALSEVHSHLDRALRFLLQDVGYALLDDARPRAGAGVRLRGRASEEPPAVRRLPWSGKLPQERSVAAASSSRAEPPEDLDSNVMELLQKTFMRNGGKLRASELAEQLAKVCQKESSFRLNGQWNRLFSGDSVDEDDEIGWEDFQSFYVEIPKAPSDVVDILEMSPEVSRHAHYKCDLVLVSRFAHLLYKGALQDSLPGACSLSDAERRCSKVVKNDNFYINILLAVRLLHLCNYDYADVVLVLAYASVYFRNTFNSIGSDMSATESAHVVVLLIFLAHVFILDETCPLRIWQKHIFRQYCTLKVLNAALFRVFQMRSGFSLRITDEEESMALLGLSGLRYSLHEGSDEEELSDNPGSQPRDSPGMSPGTIIRVPNEKKGEVGNDTVTTPGHCTTTDESE